MALLNRRSGALTRSAPEQLVSGVVGWMGSDVIFQAVETTVIERLQKVSGCSQHHPTVSQVPVLRQPREKCAMDVVERLKQVEHLQENQVVQSKRLFSTILFVCGASSSARARESLLALLFSQTMNRGTTEPR